jgi:hypothetical protein
MPMGRGAVLHTGKRAATYDARDIRWGEVRATVTLPTIKPFNHGYGMDFKAGPWPGWGMFGNGPCDDGSITNQGSYMYNGAGNCAWAGPGHETMMLDKNAGRPVAKFTCLNLLNQYAEYLGIGSATALNANNDQGSDVRQVLQWRATKGLLDVNGNAHKVGVYVSGEPGNFQDLWEMFYFFEAAGMGINFPNSAMDQFNNGKMWQPVNGAQIDGGHYIPIVGRPSNGVWTCITWGQRQLMTNSFITKYCDEIWAYISPERYNAVTGDTLENYKDADLEKFITLVGQVSG